MPTTKHWTVDLLIGETEGETHAEARLHANDDSHQLGVGRARLNPADENVPEIGDELAVARALNDLGHQLLLSAAADIQAITDERVRLLA
ncbi:DUF1876 domain-containing protein [Dactylosporangium maewongense]|uniref:DUF1876 domain-containing protein n=1 Tax=Dactylosporangium maewongense TaxID=634393 RepID=A0ABP4M0Q7_9ACTN